MDKRVGILIIIIAVIVGFMAVGNMVDAYKLKQGLSTECKILLEEQDQRFIKECR